MGGIRLFASTIDEPRARRVTDALSLLGALVLLILLSGAAEPVPRFLRRLDDLLAAAPRVLTPVWQIGADLLVLAAVLLVVAVAVRRRVGVLRDLVLAGIVAAVVWPLVARAVGPAWPSIWDGLSATEPPAWYPSPRVAIASATLLTASPHLAIPMRRLSRRLIGAGAVSMVALGATSPAGAVAALLIAVVSAAVVHLAVGSSGGRPSLRYVEAALAELGLDARVVGAADRQDAGLFRVDAVAADGTPLIAKIHGRDAHDAALISTLWRRVWRRDAGEPIRLGRRQQVEHEALMTLFVAQAEIPTDRVVTVGVTSADDAVLVLRRPGHGLTESSAPFDPALATAIWDLVGRLHDADVTHGRLDAANLLVVEDQPTLGVVGLRGTNLAAGEAARRADHVQALVTTALLSDVDTAVHAARRALGTDGVAAVLPFVQRSILTPAQRRAVRDSQIDLDDLRIRLATSAGMDPPELIELRRMTVGSAVRVLLPAIALFVLVSAASGLDVAELRAALGDASWPLVAVGVVLTQLPRLTQAVSTLGASPVPLPLGPVYALQLAMAYIGLALPSTAARVGVNIRFFQRHGVPPGSALAAGALDGLGGFVVQALILGTILLVGSATLDLDLDVGRTLDEATGLLVAVVLLVLAAIGVVAGVGRLRRFVLGWARQLWSEALSALSGLRSPRRLALLFGGSLATEVLFAVALGVFVRSLGFDIGLGELLLVNIGVALLAGLMPIPGGIGVAEGGLALGLVQAGMPDEQAIAAVLLYRLSSFYLPPIWGFVALRWLERNEHL